MGRKKKAATRRVKKKTRRGATRGAYLREAPGESMPQRMHDHLQQCVGQAVTASGLGGCYVGVLRQVFVDGVVIGTDDGAILALGMAGLELAIREKAGTGPAAWAPPSGIPPDEDI